MAYRQLTIADLAAGAMYDENLLMSGDSRTQLHALEAEPSVITATLSMGFPFADIRDAGVSVLVTTNDDQQLAEQHADKFAQYIWDTCEKHLT